MTSLVKTIAKSVVALSVICGFVFAQSQPQQQPQPKPKAAVYIMGNPEGRDALRSAVNTFLIKSGKYQMIAVDAIDIVAQEQKRQMSGAVSDGDIAALGRDAGAQYVCVVQRSELDGVSYVATRMVSVQSKVAELADIIELPPGGKIIDLIQWQIGSMLGMAVGPRPSSGASRSRDEILADIQRLEQKKRDEQTGIGGGAATSSIKGTIVPGGSLAQKLAWLQKSADSHETYIIEINADETIAPNNTLEFSGGINITVVLRGVGGNRTIRLSSHGTMFIVRKEVTFILEDKITLRGHDGNDGRLVSVDGGKLKMNAGVTITANSGGGVFVGNDGTFTMTGGTISGNGRRDIDGGGVLNRGAKATFTMMGGTITGNIASEGGGVYVGRGIFTMSGGNIIGNTASKGGGVHIGSPCLGVAFTMRGGTISNNIATAYGGGVCVEGNACGIGDFIKTGGNITGYKSDQANGNVVKDEDNNVLARKGHALYIDENRRKETTAGPGANIKDGSGPWDQ